MNPNTQRAIPAEIGFRRLVGRAFKFLSDGVLRRVIAKTIRKMRNRTACPYTTSSVMAAVGIIPFQIRAANKDAIKTRINNNGIHPAIIFENDALVGVLDCMQSMCLPLHGVGAVSARTYAGTTEIVVSTSIYTYCE